jgi:hypothetical protein
MKKLSQTRLKTANGRMSGKLHSASLCERYAELLRLREEISRLSATGIKSEGRPPTTEGQSPETSLQD